MIAKNVPPFYARIGELFEFIAVTILLNILSRQNFFEILHSTEMRKFRDVLESKVNELSSTSPFFHKWKGLLY